MSETEQRIVRDSAPRLRPDEPIVARNHRLNLGEPVGFHHLRLDTTEAHERFGQVKYVLMGGSPGRAFHVAQAVHDQLGKEIIAYGERPSIIESLQDADVAGLRHWTTTQIRQQLGIPAETGGIDRYSFYLVDDVIVVNHGMGLGSIEILLNEVLTLLAAAGAKDVKLIRIGTSGGIGAESGSVVIANRGWGPQPEREARVNEELEGGPYTAITVAGQEEWWPVHADEETAQKLLRSVPPGVSAELAGVQSKETLHPGEGLLSQSIVCDIDESVTGEHYQAMHDLGIRASEMEASMLFAITNRLGVSAATVCAVLNDSMANEPLKLTKAQEREYSARAEATVINLIAGEQDMCVNRKTRSWPTRIVRSAFRRVY